MRSSHMPRRLLMRGMVDIAPWLPQCWMVTPEGVAARQSGVTVSTQPPDTFSDTCCGDQLRNTIITHDMLPMRHRQLCFRQTTYETAQPGTAMLHANTLDPLLHAHVHCRCTAAAASAWLQVGSPIQPPAMPAIAGHQQQATQHF
jgi:hypothetical protein